jgi:hypothetical protein
MMEYWNIGITGRDAGAPATFHYSTIPVFQYTFGVGKGAENDVSIPSMA